jgi:hypothetical protein
MTFSAECRGYIGVGTLAPWLTALGGLLPPWAAALGPNATAHGARFKRRGVERQVWARYGPTPGGPYRRGPRRQMYIFAKFAMDHIFLQNREKNKYI